ncbi:MAG: hypothetical protein ACT4QD_18415 [Acidobacteriota bacterium]
MLTGRLQTGMGGRPGIGGRVFVYDPLLERRGARPAILAGCLIAVFCGVSPSAAQVTDLTANVAGSTVTLMWTGMAEDWIVEAGVVPGGVSVSQQTGRTIPGLMAVGVAAGTYYVRVRAVNNGSAGPPSNEVVVSVGGCVPTSRRIDLRSRVSGTQVSLDWGFSGIWPVAWFLEAGSMSGAADIATIVLPRVQNEFVAIAPAGTYYLRLRRSEGCDPPSNEVRVESGFPTA